MRHLSALLLESLRLAVSRYRLHPKVLVTASAATGGMLLRRLAASGTAWANVASEGSLGLARRLGQVALARAGLTPADRSLLLLAVNELLGTVPEARAYFGQVPRTPGVVSAVLEAIAELRLAVIDPAAVAIASAMPGRGEALASLLSAYADLLRERGWADPADVFAAAIDGVATGALGSTLVLLPDNLSATGLEEAFLAALPEASVIQLATDTLAGQGPPPATPRVGTPLRADVPAGPMEAFLAPTRPVEAVEMAFAASPLGEVRTVLRQVLALGVPWDDVELVLVHESHHLRLVRDEAQRLRIPCTFGPGWPVAWTAPGRAVEAYLAWVRDDFPARTLADALATGDLQLPETAAGSRVSGTLAARILRRAGIGWGRDRYGPSLHAYAASLALPDPEADVDQPAEGTSREAAITAVAACVQDLLARTPRPNAAGRLDLCALVRAAAHMARTLAAADAGGEALAERLDAAAPWMGTADGVGDAVERIRAVVADLRLGAALAAPGRLHVSLGTAGGVTGRSHTFILGLDENAGGGAAPSPLLGDPERLRLGLPTGDQRAARRRADFGRMLAGLRGRVFVSYAAANPGSGRRGFPSSLLLQTFRLRQGRADLDYTALTKALGDPAPAHLPGGLLPLDRGEGWLGRIAAEGLGADAREALTADNPWLRRGACLRSARRSPEVTPFDGQITPDLALDPRRNPDLVVSAHRLELLAKCPLAYFFQYVLQVRPLDEVVREPGVWLDARERGSLLHAIYRRFLEAAAGFDLGTPAARDRLRAVAWDTLQEWRQNIPPPSEPVFAREAADILGSLNVFLHMEQAETGARPRLFELAFGLPDADAAPESPPLPPARLAVAGGEIRVRGRIDRADEVAPGLFRIWDYKTGRLWDKAYPEDGLVVRGRLLQHALYAAVGEQILAGAGHAGARIVASGYRFATELGEGQVWLPEGDTREALGQVVDALLGLVASGTFVAAEDAHHCRFCDFKDACDRQAAAEATAAKLASGDDRLGPLRAVSAHA